MSQPERPGIVLRIAAAGNRKINPTSEPAISTRVVEVLSTIEAAMLSLPAYEHSEAGVAYAAEKPALRLVSGLADGGDQIASEAFLASRHDDVDRSMTAVLPFDVDTYRDRSPISNVARFEKQLAVCRPVLVLDGRYADGDDRAARRARAAAYRAQSELLLRQADILIAIEDPAAPAKPGGTRETIARALHLGVPVIHLPLGDEPIAILRSSGDLAGSDSDTDWHADIAAIVRAILADPRTTPARSFPPLTPPEQRDLADRLEYEDELIGEFFTASVPAPTLRHRRWSRFEGRFRRSGAAAKDSMPAKFHDWRAKASALSAHYAGLYRGTFLLNYTLAVIAVSLAVAALVILTVSPHAHEFGYAWILLVIFGGGEVFVLMTIQRLTGQANRNRWNDKAVDYRYLAERLRAMAYLPQIGTMRALPSGSGGYATRVSTRSVVDWLFQAMVRHVSLDQVTPPPEADRPIAPDPRAAAVAIRHEWLANQADYHAGNASTMGLMSKTLEKTGRAMNLIVIGTVCVDLAILIVTGLNALPHTLADSLVHLSPWLLFVAATVPATVASLNGIRFQSECARLADRSIQMGRMLSVLTARADETIAGIDRSRETPTVGPGHVIDVLHLAEDCAKLTLDEVAEWSFVYAKEIIEP